MAGLLDMLGDAGSAISNGAGGLLSDFAQLPQAIQGQPPQVDPSIAQMLPPGAQQQAQGQYGSNFWNNFARASGNGQGFWAALGDAGNAATQDYGSQINRSITAANMLRQNRMQQQQQGAYQQLLADPTLDSQTKQMLQLGGPQAAQQFLERKQLMQMQQANKPAQTPFAASPTERYVPMKDAAGNVTWMPNKNYDPKASLFAAGAGADPNNPFNPLTAAVQTYADTGTLPRGQDNQRAVLSAFPAFAAANGWTDPTDLSAHRAMYKSTLSSLGRVQYMSSAVGASTQALEAHLQTAGAILNQTDPSGVPLINKIKVNASGELDADGGGDWVPALRAAMRGAASELAKIQSGNPLSGQALTDAGMKDVQSVFNSYLSKGQFDKLQQYAQVEAAQKNAAFQDTMNGLTEQLHSHGTHKPVNPYAAVPGLPGTGLVPGYTPPGANAAGAPGAPAAPAAVAPAPPRVQYTYVPGKGLVPAQ